jgi:hypothetical protein
MRWNLALAVAALAAVACTPEFDPASRIEKLRVLAIKAEPPEIDPGGVATLESLVVRADFAADPLRTTTVVHVACVPIPGDPATSPCVAFSTLGDPAAAIAAGAQAACAGGGAGSEVPPIDFAGVEACQGGTCAPAAVGGAPLRAPQLAVPAGLPFPADGPERILGVQAIVLAFALDATPDELVQGVGTTCPTGDLAANLASLWSSREHVLSTKRVQIRGPQAIDPANHNPADEVPGLSIAAGTTPLDPGVVTTVERGTGTIALKPVLPPGAEPEEYAELDASGQVIERKREEWVYSWFSTAGELDELHTRGVEPDAWTVGPTRAMVAVVVRDLRGGVAWAVREVAVAP